MNGEPVTCTAPPCAALADSTAQLETLDDVTHWEGPDGVQALLKRVQVLEARMEEVTRLIERVKTLEMRLEQDKEKANEAMFGLTHLSSQVAQFERATVDTFRSVLAELVAVRLMHGPQPPLAPSSHTSSRASPPPSSESDGRWP